MAPSDGPNWKRLIITFLIVFAVGGLLAYRGGCPGGQQAMRSADARLVDVKIGRWTVKAEVADTPELRQKGLQLRPALEGGYGMLFVFDEPQVPSFWMKDTIVALSIAFIREDGTIVHVARMEPKDLTSISPEEPVKYALEVRQGWFEDRQIGPGTKAEMPSEIPPLPAPATPAK